MLSNKIRLKIYKKSIASIHDAIRKTSYCNVRKKFIAKENKIIYGFMPSKVIETYKKVT